MSEVKINSKVSVHYTGKLTTGEVFDTSREREPLSFTVGTGQLIKGFENGVLGMKVNETKTVNIPAEEGYGAVKEELIQKINKSDLPEGLDPKVGQQLASQHPSGQQMVFLVIDEDSSSITIDGNHELAGKDLVFEIEVVEIQ
jgi:FKBP-type peptidyl-prolyl cis-trans isomerase SlpA